MKQQSDWNLAVVIIVVLIVGTATLLLIELAGRLCAYYERRSQNKTLVQVTQADVGMNVSPAVHLSDEKSPIGFKIKIK